MSGIPVRNVPARQAYAGLMKANASNEGNSFVRPSELLKKRVATTSARMESARK